MAVILPSSLLMSIGGSEWIIIILLGLVLLFGTKKLPQVSRTIGKAVGEYEKAREMFRKEMQDAMDTNRNADTVVPSSATPRITGPVSTEREKLETIAQSLGIDHAGKTDAQLRSMIADRMHL